MKIFQPLVNLMGYMKDKAVGKKPKPRIDTDPNCIELPDGSIAYRVGSDSDPGKEYLVTKHAHGRITCTCPHYKLRLNRKGRLCKHATKLLAEGKI